LQNDDNDCGSAAFASIARHYGYQMSIEEAKELAQIHQLGQSVWDLADAANDIGIEGRPAYAERYEILKDISTPFIAHYGGEQAHFVVVYKVWENDLIIADPAFGLERMSPETFKKKWSGYIIEFEPKPTFKKRIYSPSAKKIYFNLLRENRYAIYGIIAFSLIISILGLASSYFIKIIIDEILPSQSINNLLFIAGILIVVYTSYFALDITRSLFQARISKRILKGNIKSYVQHVGHLPIRFHETRSLGNLFNRLNDIDRIQYGVSQSFFSLFSDSIFMIISLTVMFLFSSHLFFLVLLFIPVILCITLLFSVSIRKLQRMILIRQGEVADKFMDTFSGIQEVKMHSAENYYLGKIEEKAEGYISLNYRLNLLMSCSNAISYFLITLLSVIILWQGTILVANNVLTLGSMMLFFTLMTFVTSPVNRVASVLYLISDSLTAIERVQGIKDVKQEEQIIEKKTFTTVQGKIRFENVCFEYRKYVPLFQNISFTIDPGQSVAIVGSTGAGKTTLIKLLCGFYKPTSGSIYLDETPLSEISYDILRQQISLVSQRPHLFRDNLYRNVTMGDSIDIKTIEDKPWHDSLFGFVKELPQGYLSPVFSAGNNFSAGQIQRLAILRALLHNKPILIFDEATSNLDSITENMILQVLRTECKGKTRVVIGHRLSTIAAADKILVVDNGKIAEEGTFTELVDKKGLFYNLFRLQIEKGTPTPEIKVTN